MSEKKRVDIILLTYNNALLTKEAIESLMANTDYPYRLIIVDNASRDGTREYLVELARTHPEIKVLLKKEEDQGYSDGINTGLKYSDSDYVCLASNDLFFRNKNWLEEMVKIMDLDEKVAIVGCKLLFPDNSIQHGGGSFTSKELNWYHIGRSKPGMERDQIEENIAVTSALCLVRRKALPDRKWNQWRQGMWNDVHECLLLRKLGYKIFYCGTSVVYHHESKTQDASYYAKWGMQMRRNNRLFFDTWTEWLKEFSQKRKDLFDK